VAPADVYFALAGQLSPGLPPQHFHTDNGDVIAGAVHLTPQTAKSEFQAVEPVPQPTAKSGFVCHLRSFNWLQSSIVPITIRGDGKPVTYSGLLS